MIQDLKNSCEQPFEPLLSNLTNTAGAYPVEPILSNLTNTGAEPVDAQLYISF